ncbi:SAM-dependent methyltransferase [Rhodovibrio salinarum]|nr:class I SAM-dependent methyltransferase [Rhodovibrio salinarum]
MRSPQDQRQAEAYAFPYHHLPALTPVPTISRYWSFAPSYVAGLWIVTDWMDRNLSSNPNARAWRHVDIGCGDGALLRHLSRRVPADRLNLTGVDTDRRAIAWARMFNDASVDIVCDAHTNMEPGHFDSASLVEVLEHVPPECVPAFVSGAARLLRNGGRLMVTVPSVAKPTEAKHYQHFSRGGLLAALADDFDVDAVAGFENRLWPARVLRKLVWRKRFRLDWPPTTHLLVSAMARRRSNTECCGRILAEATRRSA